MKAGYKVTVEHTKFPLGAGVVTTETVYTQTVPDLDLTNLVNLVNGNLEILPAELKDVAYEPKETAYEE